MHFHTYADAIAYLDRYIPGPGQGFSPDHALTRTRVLLAHLGDPQDAVPVIHLAGTSGKGSTAALLAAVLRAHGLHVGLGTSPHVRHLRERICVDGAAIDEAAFCAALAEIVPAVEATAASDWGAPSFFEILIALSYHHFARLPVDVVVMETGLGGMYDATNTVSRRDKLAVLTPIGLDHTEFLGNTVATIAAAKCGIILPGNEVFSAAQSEAAAQVIAATCRSLGVPLTVFDPTTMLRSLRADHDGVTFDLHLGADVLDDLRVPLPGAHQAANAGHAVQVAQAFLARSGRRLDPCAAATGLAQVDLPGRMEWRTWHGRAVLLDGAHNPQKIDAVCRALEALYPGMRFPVVVALKRDKAAADILQRLQPLTDTLICTQFTNTDQGMPLTAATADAIAQAARDLGYSTVRAVASPAAALAAAAAVPGAAPVLVTGSIYLLAEIYAALEAATAAAHLEPKSPGYTATPAQAV